MKSKIYPILGALGILVCACQSHRRENDVVSQRYVHKYGYAVSQEEWESKNYPGQVITNLKNGVTVTATYENGYLHGPCNHTFPNSQTVEVYSLYNQDQLVKEIRYDIRGMPVREMVQLSPTRYSLTLWYNEGSPLSIEEYASEELLDAQYFTVNNETEGRVERGNGLRVRRDQYGTLISRDEIQGGYMVKRDTFYASGAPESSSHYLFEKLHGEKRAFAETGEPIAIEEYLNGALHGKATYFNNGTKYLEISYLDGFKNGIETHYVDGEEVSQEIHWENDKKHGPSTYYIDGYTQIHWYYDGERVSRNKYEELARLDDMISQISPDVTLYR
jgi:antitoxin component YwqK of YwqJK toxin-antitoxin module